MKQYLDLVKLVMENGTIKSNRTGVNTISYFGAFYKVDLSDGFPLLTTKKMYWNSLLREVLWYLSGENHIRNLRKHTKIWNSWADKDGNLETAYGYYWRHFPSAQKNKYGKWEIKEVDQIKYILDEIEKNELLNYTAAADVGLSLIEDISLSYHYALPNKLFEYIMAEIPVIVSNLPQMVEIVMQYNVGEVVESDNQNELINKINLLFEDEELYSSYKANCKSASKELNWDNEINILFNVLENLN